MKNTVNWIKKYLDDVETGEEGKASRFYGFAVYTMICTLIGGLVPLVYGDWSSAIWQRLLPIAWALIVVNVLVLIGACFLGNIARESTSRTGQYAANELDQLRRENEELQQRVASLDERRLSQPPSM